MHGARIQLRNHVPLTAIPATGADVDVTLALDGASVTLRCRIAHRHRDNAGPVLGLRFLAVASDHEQLLQSIVLHGRPI